jgi:hypothetical protein
LWRSRRDARSGKKRRLREFRRGESEIRVLSNEWDVIPGSPPDEYDCLIPQLYSLLSQGAQPEEIEDYLASELEGHFGVEPDAARERELAGRLVTWAQSLRSRRAGSA